MASLSSKRQVRVIIGQIRKLPRGRLRIPPSGFLPIVGILANHITSMFRLGKRLMFSIKRKYNFRASAFFVFGDEHFAITAGLVLILQLQHQDNICVLFQLTRFPQIRAFRRTVRILPLQLAQCQNRYARVSRTVRRLREMGLEILGLSHCSGEAAECAICRDRTVKSCHMGSGDCIFLDLD